LRYDAGTASQREEKKIAGALFMDVKSAFNNMDKTFLRKCMEALGLEADLIWWTMSFMTDRRVRCDTGVIS